jgi:threonine dehydrogenase-like Zn-dependent dehydrogenase
VKAALYEGVKSVSIVDRPMPKAGPGEAVVKIALCGICGTDLHIYFEGMLPPPFVPGHENVGTIVELGEGVPGFKVGDRVVAGPPGNCGRCFYCLHGRPNLCVDGFGNTNGLTRDGGMAEYMLVRDARQMLYPIPENVSFEDAVLTDTIATALRALSQSALAMGDNVVVSGAGPIGLAAIQVLKLAGARHVTALEIVPEKRKLAAALGADLVLDPVAEGDGLKDRITSLYGGVGPDLVAECAGKAQSLGLCIDLVRNGGQVLNVGAGGEALPVVPAMLAVREVGLKSSLAYGAKEAKLTLDYLAAGRLNTGGMLSDVIPLADIIEKGFQRLVADRSLVKVAIRP